MNALVREVCGPATAPREWRRSLGKQRLALHSAIVQSSLVGVGVRFGGALVGEELIGTLSERLARSLQGLDVSPSENVDAGAAVRRAMESVGELPTTRRMDASERAVVESGVRAQSPAQRVVERRGWSSDVARDDRRRAGDTTSTELQRLREIVSAVVDERGTQVVRAVGLDVPSEQREREVVRVSPLDAALRRYWQTSTRATAEPVPRMSGTVVSPKDDRNAPVQDATDTRSRMSAASVEPSATRTALVSPDRVAPPEPRGWWSTRVDAIHSRTESFMPAPARPTAARFDDDDVDDSAFADALAEVLHRQARAYGVVVP
jgi:hypothetical protein